MPAEGQGVDGTLQYESRGIGAPELNASEIGGGVERAHAQDAQEASTQAVGNHRRDFKTQEEHAPSTPKKRYEANVAALKLLNRLRIEGRKEITHEEQKF
ncbi:hypothetical protein NHP194003_16420 [Helicobacter suis]|nr:hypothetical protein NHP194003_16420 [Helicobacter suis]